ncbi:putative PurR-regulated permease PerM [Agitococcus lubricus]|uniref:Putative PurR-regulated permease PerM n=2 Tax=Agitococcus lubricus TaxID=1077255 RepID=A0A2T5J3X5_9GAMM|nr:putative PurR-regulated permease PerM [Agitococcus lubricus]
METLATKGLHRALLAIILIILFVLAYQVLAIFMIPVAWAGILAYVTWPAYARLQRRFPYHPNTVAGLMSFALTLLIVVPLLVAIFTLRHEAALVYDLIASKIGQGSFQLPTWLKTWPFAKELQAFLDNLLANPESFKAQIQIWFQKGFGAAAQVAGSIGKNVAKLMMVLFILFFFYRDGEKIVAQVQRALQVLIGERVHRYIQAIGDTTRAVVYGIVLTALAQGFLAGVGYAVAGLESPVFLAALTAMIAMIPFGTPFAWGSIALWLMMSGQHVAGIGLALWGALVVSSIDNVIRPLVISSATQIPFLLVMFGVLGGLSAFGMVGLFLGPVILAILLAIWQQWLDDKPTAED